MRRLFALAIAALVFVSCRQVESGTMTVRNSLTVPVRVTVSENYGSETLTLAAGETIRRDYDRYRSISLPDETPRARYVETDDDFEIIPLDPKTVTLYVTNGLGSAVTLVNARETDTADYAIPAGAVNLAVTFSYYQFWELAAKGVTDDSITVKKTIVKTSTTDEDTGKETTEEKTYILVGTPGS
jgi:hypothetical protein